MSEIFDPDTRQLVLRETARPVIIACTVVAVLMAGMIAVLHHELPFLAYMAGACSPEDFVYECDRARFDALAGVLGLVVIGGGVAVMYRFRRMPPTITCESCGGRGWVLDLEPRGGRCPRCAGHAFTYRTTLGSANGLGPVLTRVVEEHQDGADLLRRMHATRNSWTDRYY